MFSQIHPELDAQIRRILSTVKSPSEGRTIDLLHKSEEENLPLQEVAELLEVEEKNKANRIYLLRNFTSRRFKTNQGNELRNISPIYLSSHCIDTCGYCQFSANRTETQRTRLSMSQLEEELGAVIKEGNHVIEFTLATDPHFTPKELIKYIERTKQLLDKKSGGGILLCSDYLSEEVYNELKVAGLFGMVQWDETLDKNRYGLWHKTSPRKRNFEDRIDNHDRAIKAGLEVAMGTLFGLADFRYDVLMQIGKARYLVREYGRKPIVFGTPRLKPIGGKVISTKQDVDDRTYEIALMAYKVAEPQIARWLQTRETLELNLRNMLNGDICTYRCGDVKPGGYKVNIEAISSSKGSQFVVNELERTRFESRLAEAGFSVNYAWIK